MSAQVALPGDFGADTPPPYSENVPHNLRRATARLQFPPSYVVVGIYRLFTDRNLFVPAWKKCQHGVVRGLGVGLVWAVSTFKLQRWIIERFYMNSPRVLGLSTTGRRWGLATFFFVATQVSGIVTYFVSHGLRVARERAYNQTIESRNKGPDFWHPYVEEWDNPPTVSKSVGYFQAKGMTTEQVSIFMEERKWDYRAFGFVAALLERIPLLGLVFSVSNRIGAAMWAVDLEKRQHYVAEMRIPPGSKSNQVKLIERSLFTETPNRLSRESSQA
ncbi:uncharacterized protein B0H18DRAFT_1006135 [Fomitopsis serialis]|uniref:uncharacterized protein n=1 Tax=Fomitopsis serialis TaxID=139415 RepID=UPI002007252F|nr:uncharacterized protein B0H18DRAFT_1006135 [Neoantrodia serialis]KAH9926445.1 hypothetical protein B0H18DRAFT_1006135 [Neoantrodia serialis]